jgi:hypothetical protein
MELKKEDSEGTKGVPRGLILKKSRQYNDQNEKGQTTIYNTLHRKLNIEQDEPH